MDPTALARLSKDIINHHHPSYNNTAKVSSHSWTFNKTLSNLIRLESALSTVISAQFIYLIKQSLFFILQEKYSEIPRSGERHLYSKGHAETGGHHPLCFRPPQHHKHLRKSLPSFANCIPHEEPASQALRHCGKLWDPAEQQLRTRD